MPVYMSMENILPQMMPGVTFTPPTPPPAPPAPVPGAVPALGLNYTMMRVNIYGNVKIGSYTQGITLQVL